MMGAASGRYAFRFPRLRARERHGDGDSTAVGVTGGTEDRRILDIDGYVHVVDGRIVCFERHMFRLSSESDREVLFREARKQHGGGVRVLVDPGDGSGNYISETREIGSFTEPRQAAIRAAGAPVHGSGDARRHRGGR